MSAIVTSRTKSKGNSGLKWRKERLRVGAAEAAGAALPAAAAGAFFTQLEAPVEAPVEAPGVHPAAAMVAALSTHSISLQATVTAVAGAPTLMPSWMRSRMLSATPTSDLVAVILVSTIVPEKAALIALPGAPSQAGAIAQVVQGAQRSLPSRDPEGSNPLSRFR